MAPPLEQPEIYKKRLTRVRRKPQLSDIKEEDELKKTNQDLSTLYLSQEESKKKSVTSKIPKPKKKVMSKLTTTKQTPTPSKEPLPKGESSEKEKKDTASKTKRKVSKNKTKTEVSSPLPQKSPTPLKHQSTIRNTYVPVVRSFVDPDLTSLPLDDIMSKRPYLAKNDSNLPKPAATKLHTKKSKKSSTENTGMKKAVPEKDKLIKTSYTENMTSSKKHKVQKNVSRIPKKVKSKKTTDSKKIVAKIPLN